MTTKKKQPAPSPSEGEVVSPKPKKQSVSSKITGKGTRAKPAVFQNAENLEAIKAGKAKRVRPRTVRKKQPGPGFADENHPDTIDYRRMCEHAWIMRHRDNTPYWEIASTLWPLDENGEPAPGAQPMWNSADAAMMAIRRHDDRRKGEVDEGTRSEIRSVHEATMAALMPKLLAGDLFTISVAQRQMEFWARYTGAMAPTKIAPTTPDGSEAAPLVDLGAGLSGLLARARAEAAASSDGGRGETVATDVAPTAGSTSQKDA